MLASKLLPEQDEQQTKQLQDLQQLHAPSASRQQAAYVQVQVARALMYFICNLKAAFGLIQAACERVDTINFNMLALNFDSHSLTLFC
jgi:hypothetical protein